MSPRQVVPTLTLPAAVRTTPIAVVETVILPQELPNIKKHLPLIFLDERLVSDGTSWTYVPSVDIIRPAKLLLLSLRSAGLTIKSFPSLHDAKQNGAKVALITVQKFAQVRYPDAHWRYTFWGLTEAKATASVELHVVLVGLEDYKVISKESFQAHAEDELQVPAPLYPDFIRDVSNGDIEPQLHPFRILLARAYYDVAISLIPFLDKALSEGGL